MAKQEPFTVPDLKDQVGWRLSDQDKKDLRILMASRRERNLTNLLRDVVHQEASAVRQRWSSTPEPVEQKEEADG